MSWYKCRKCGRETCFNKGLCHECLNKFVEKRKEIYKKAKEKFGEITAINLKAFQAYMKSEEDKNG
jgi:predicted ATP-dependent serine protease